MIPDSFTHWSGGDCPVDPWTWVKVIYRDGSTDLTVANDLDWHHRPSLAALDIVAYKIQISLSQKSA